MSGSKLRLKEIGERKALGRSLPFGLVHDFGQVRQHADDLGKRGVIDRVGHGGLLERVIGAPEKSTARRPFQDAARQGAIAGKAFDSSPAIVDLDERGAKALISQYPPQGYAACDRRRTLKVAHLIKNFFCKLEESKRIATRSGETDQSFSAMIRLAAAIYAL